jgi:hypothetical protein
LLALVLGKTSAAEFSASAARRSAVWVLVPGGVGSGFLLDRQRGLIVTAGHVVSGASTVRVAFPEYREGQLVRDPTRIPARARAVRLAQSEPRPGNRIHFISGVPVGRQAAFQHVSGTVQSVRWRRGLAFGSGPVTPSHRLIFSNLPTVTGNSGAGVVNDRGQLVGVHYGTIYHSGQGATVVITEVRPFLLPPVGAYPAGNQARAAFVSRSGTGFWLAPRSGAITRPIQNTWTRSGSSAPFAPATGTGLWFPGNSGPRNPTANTWGPSTRWVATSGNGFWFTPYSGSPSEPRAAQWSGPGSSGQWVSERGPGVWYTPSSGPSRPQTNNWRPVRHTPRP